MEQEDVADLTEQCRLCLESDPSMSETYHIDSSCGSITDKTVVEVIKYCLGFDVKSIGGSEFLPQQICGSCLIKLEETYAFKEKSQQTNETLKGILDNIGIAASNDYLDSDLDSSLLQEVDAPPNLNSYTTVEKSNEGRKLTLFTCKICTKTFKYAKPFMNHMLNHNPNFIESELESNTLTCQICMRTFKSSKLYVKHKATHDEDYSNDYRLPYYYSKQLDQNQEPAVKKGRGRPRKTIDFSPPEHDTLISTNVMNSVNQIDYSETFPSYSNPAASSTLMASPEKRGRGRPRKFPIKYQESSQKNTFQVPMTSIASSSGYVKKAPEERKMHWKQKLALEKKSALAIKQEDSTNSSCIKPSSFQHQDDDIFSGFVEVDLNKVLKKKTTDDDASNSSKSLKKIKIEKSSSRSRSPSIELIQEEDIFNTS